MIFFFVVGYRASKIPRLILLFLTTWLAGTFIGVIFTTRMIDVSQSDSARVRYWLVVACYIISSESFNWVIFLRFKGITPFKKRLNRIIFIWLCIESLTCFANYCFWFYAGTLENAAERDKALSKCVSAYAVVTSIQALTDLFLTGYFVFRYYLPTLHALTGTKKKQFLLSSGLSYLLANLLLHILYPTLVLVRQHVTEVKFLMTPVINFGTALRYSLFLAFLFQMKRTNSIAEEHGVQGIHALHNPGASSWDKTIASSISQSPTIINTITPTFTVSHISPSHHHHSRNIV